MASDRVFPNPDYPSTEPGLTKRELFAAMAMQGLQFHREVAATEERRDHNFADPATIVVGTAPLRPLVIARMAVGYADALIAELEKK